MAKEKETELPANTKNNQLAETSSLKELIESPIIKEKFAAILKNKASGFTASLLQVVGNNKSLQNAEPNSIIGAAMTAAVLDLPINNNLGFAYVVPYKAKNDKGDYIDVAQFQLGYKGFIQLAQRSGQFKSLNVCAVYSDDTDDTILKRLTSFFPIKATGNVVGYVAYFELLNGFSSKLPMTIQELEDHGKKYSQVFKKYGTGLWKDEFDGMAKKTVLKLLLSRFAPLSIEMQKAITFDQGVIDENENLKYADNIPNVIDMEEFNANRIATVSKLWEDNKAKIIKHSSEIQDETKKESWNKTIMSIERVLNPKNVEINKLGTAEEYINKFLEEIG